MTIGIIVTITNPDQREDKWREALRCYSDLADEIVVVNGGGPVHYSLDFCDLTKVKEVKLPWPKEWNWVELPRHLNAGLEALTTEWCLKIDIVYPRHLRESALIRFCVPDLPKKLI